MYQNPNPLGVRPIAWSEVVMWGFHVRDVGLKELKAKASRRKQGGCGEVDLTVSQTRFHGQQVSAHEDRVKSCEMMRRRTLCRHKFAFLDQKRTSIS